MDGKSHIFKCWRSSASLACFFILCSFLFVAGLSFYASPDKLFVLLGHVKKQIGSLNTKREYEVWPSPQFWQKLSPGRGRQMRNHCRLSDCGAGNQSQSQSQSQFRHPFNPQHECPLYFRYIHEDLAPWSHVVPPGKNGSIHVSKQMLDKAIPRADFRVVIKKGRLYVDVFRPCFQTRSIFTIWGLLQLLRFYPGLVPNVDMLFGCGDTPRVFRRDYKDPSVSPPPPVFRYCSTPLDYDIPFPDWTFWGWPEVNLKPWDNELGDILKGENELLWEERHPTAFWKGNTDTGRALRKALQRCNGQHNGATIIHQNWYEERKATFKNSKLAKQCKHRYKIYAEGWGWSVSLKYIMACDSPTFIIDPVFHDFFMRGLMPLRNFWPVRRDKLCSSIKFGTEWGNNNTVVAEAIGRAGRQYVTKELSMKHVYDYMLHMLYEYAKRLDFKPEPGANMKELCVDAFLCQAPVEEKVLYGESMVKEASEEAPCYLPPRDEAFIGDMQARRHNITQLVRNAEESADGGAYLKAHLLKSNGAI